MSAAASDARSADQSVPAIVANENTHEAGRQQGTTRAVDLDITRGHWFPDGPSGASAIVSAFAERGHAPQIPGPLLRVAVGTDLRLRIRNTLARSIAVHDFVDVPSTADRPIEISSGETRIVRIRTFAPGTFHYWAASPGVKLGDRLGEDALLSGAIVVDPPGPVPPDHIFVLSSWYGVNDAKGDPNTDYSIEAINGRAWPATERLSYMQGAHVVWHVVNGSPGTHPMHLHGFPFAVVARGDGTDQSAVSDEPEVTERVASGHTSDIHWTAARPGVWMFHCHIMYHTAPHDARALTFAGKAEAPMAFEDSVHHPMRDGAMTMDSMMGGMIIALTVHARGPAPKPPVAAVPQRRLQLTVASVAPAVTTVDAEMWPSFTYTLADSNGHVIPSTAGAPIIVLTRGVPVAITVINHLDEATAVHWHGVDVQDSYFDGSGLADPWGRPSAMIMPGKSFVAHFTPMRAGTFMYHSHMDDPWQIPAGLAGALLVLEPGERYDVSTDHVVMITRPRDANSNMVNVNGTLNPAPIEMRASARQRLRICNLTDLRTEMVARFLPSETGALPVWNLVAQDGVDLHRPRSIAADAGVQVTVGQTRDVEFAAPPPGTYTLQVQTRFGGRALAKVPVIVQ